MSTTRTTPPAGWELVVNVPEYAPNGFDIWADAADIYESPEYTKDGETKVSASWTSEDGPLIFVRQDGHEIMLPSPWAARKLSELLWQIAAEAEQ